MLITLKIQRSLRQAQILILEIFNIFLPLKFLPSLTLTKSGHFSKVSIHNFLFLFLSLFYFIFAFHLYQATKGFPGFTKTNVDEIYFIYQQAFNFYHFGPMNSWFLQDLASGLDPSAHPYVYTHNIAFPNLVGYFLMILGMTKLEHFSLISIFLSYAGYSLGYLFFRKYVSPGMALLFFFVNLANYQEVLTHSMNFFRPFQLLLFYAVPYSFLEWSKNTESRKFIFLFFLSLLLSVSYEYTFAMKMYFLVFFLYFFNVYRCKKHISQKKLLTIMFAAFIIPFGLQRVMILGMFGVEYTIYDIIATLGNRAFSNNLDMNELVSYYGEKGSVFWAYSDKPGFLSGITMLWKAIMNRYPAFLVVSALAVVCLHIASRIRKSGLILLISKSYILIRSYSLIRKKLEDYPVNGVAFVSCTVLSLLVYLLIFYYHVLMVNIGSSVPLIEMYTIPSVCIIILIIYRFINATNKFVYCRFLFFSVAIISFLLIYITQFVDEYYLNPPVPMAACDVLPKYQGKSFVTSYHSVYPTIFTKHWVVPNWNKPITPENVIPPPYNYIWLKDKNSLKGQKYSNPEYYLYINRSNFPTISERMRSTFEIVEEGDNYQIYKLR